MLCELIVFQMKLQCPPEGVHSSIRGFLSGNFVCFPWQVDGLCCLFPCFIVAGRLDCKYNF